MAKGRIHQYDAMAISGRLKAFAVKYCGSWEKFVARAGVARTTADSWRRKRAPSVPDAATLLLLARKVNIDLNWLLMGQGGRDVWELHDPDIDRQFELTIEAVLRATEPATSQEFTAAWNRLRYRGDFSRKEDVILPLAVEGVRQRFQENLRLIRHYAGVMTVLNEIVPQIEAQRGRMSPKKAEWFKQLVREAMLSSHSTGDS